MAWLLTDWCPGNDRLHDFNFLYDYLTLDEDTNVWTEV